MNRLDIFSDEYIKLFELKCNQQTIKYKNKIIFKIIYEYFLRIAYSLLLSFKSKKKYNNSIVISHIDFIDNYNFLKSENYLKYNLVYNDIFFFIKEFVRFPKYLYWFFKIKSDYKNQIFEAFLKSQIIMGFVQYHNIKKVIFWGYDYDLSFLYATIQLNIKNIRTELYCNSGFLGVHNLEVANKLYCRTKIHKNYILKRKNIFLSQDIEHLFDYKKIVMKNQVKKIAVYTSGYYARTKLNFADASLMSRGVIAEEKIIETMTKYVLNNKNIEIVLFIHLHNNIENIDDAKRYYSDFLSLNNVRLQKENENSIKNFSNYELGICCMSEIFFDRYERGYKTILMNPFNSNDFIMNSSLKNVTLYSDDLSIMDKINHFFKMSNKEYYHLLDRFQ